MKKSLQLTSLAAMFVAASAFSAEPAPTVAPPPSPPTELSKAVTALSEELKTRMDLSGGDMVVRLDKLYGKALSAATAEQVARILGNATLAQLERQVAANGDTEYSFKLQPSSYTGTDGGAANWGALAVTQTMDKAGVNSTGSLRWDQLDWTHHQTQVVVRLMTMDGQQRRVGPGQWVGKASGGIVSTTILNPAMPMPLTLSALRYDMASEPRGKLVDYRYDVGIAAVSTPAVMISDLRFKMRFTGLDLAALQSMAKNQGIATLAPEKQLEAMLPLLRAMLKSAKANKSAFEIDDLSGAFKGHRLVIKGRVTAAPGADSKLARFEDIANKIDANLTVTVPMGLVKEVSQSMARQQLTASAKGEPVNEQAVVQMGTAMSDGVVGQMVSKGFVRMEGDALVSNIVFKAGKLTVNGQVVQLPKAQTAAPAKKAGAPARPSAK